MKPRGARGDTGIGTPFPLTSASSALTRVFARPRASSRASRASSRASRASSRASRASSRALCERHPDPPRRATPFPLPGSHRGATIRPCQGRCGLWLLDPGIVSAISRSGKPGHFQVRRNGHGRQGQEGQGQERATEKGHAYSKGKTEAQEREADSIAAQRCPQSGRRAVTHRKRATPYAIPVAVLCRRGKGYGAPRFSSLDFIWS